VEVTPAAIRVRKRYLKEHERNQARRERAAERESA
jgi:predicted membrane GTPase involved in stress response